MECEVSLVRNYALLYSIVSCASIVLIHRVHFYMVLLVIYIQFESSRELAFSMDVETKDIVLHVICVPIIVVTTLKLCYWWLIHGCMDVLHQLSYVLGS